jgi:protein-S-isoprenylcysteine O-methyltransferase Ste14
MRFFMEDGSLWIDYTMHACIIASPRYYPVLPPSSRFEAGARAELQAAGNLLSGQTYFFSGRPQMDAMAICGLLWGAFLLGWLLWAFKTKRTQVREGLSSRLSYTILNVAAFYLMFSGDVPREYLHARLFEPTVWSNALGIAITAAGIAFAFWARAYLGSNWSSAVTVKVGHELVRSGPYRFVRHPIYTGLILALFGTGIVRHQVRGVIAVVLAYIGFKIKSKIEERTMINTFGAQYDEYSRTTGAIVPRLWP